MHAQVLLAGPVAPLRVRRDPMPAVLDCTDPRYADVFTGARRRNPATIVDFVPIGYELDLLELRLLENYEHVDLFVVYEAELTQRGVPKPLYVQPLLATRFAPFADKILHVVGTAAQLAGAKAKTSCAKGASWKQCASTWELEFSMRRLPVAAFRASMLPSVARLRDAAGSVLALQNDADEIVSARALRHLRHCEPRTAPPYFAPAALSSFSYGLLMEQSRGPPDATSREVILNKWLAAAAASANRSSATAGAPALTPTAVHTLHRFLWSMGPTVLPLQAVLELGEVRRDHTTGMRAPQLGPLASTHMSTVAEPINLWLKAGGTIEAQGEANAFSPELLDAMRAGAVTPALLWQQIYPFCGQVRSGQYLVHASQLDGDSVEQLWAALPWAIRANALRYPFMLRGGHAHGGGGGGGGAADGKAPKALPSTDARALVGSPHCCWTRTRDDGASRQAIGARCCMPRACPSGSSASFAGLVPSWAAAAHIDGSR